MSWISKFFLGETGGIIEPEGVWHLEVGTDDIGVTDPLAETITVSWDNLAGIVIRVAQFDHANAAIWWLLFGQDHEFVCAFPQSAVGELEAVTKFLSLPGFDLDKFNDAISSDGTGDFEVWRQS